MAFNILIVDDSQVARNIVARTIRMSGAPVGEIHEAENGAQALQALGDNWIDLVMADINMPVMDGFAMIERMNRDEIMRRVPVVVISTEGSETKLEKLREQRVCAIIHKPFTAADVRVVLINLLGQWETSNAQLPSNSF